MASINPLIIEVKYKMRTEYENCIPSFLALQEAISTAVGECLAPKTRKKPRGRPKPLGLPYLYKAGILRRDEVFGNAGLSSISPTSCWYSESPGSPSAIKPTPFNTEMRFKALGGC